jgi:hypothetical protein
MQPVQSLISRTSQPQYVKSQTMSFFVQEAIRTISITTGLQMIKTRVIHSKEIARRPLHGWIPCIFRIRRIPSMQTGRIGGKRAAPSRWPIPNFRTALLTLTSHTSHVLPRTPPSPDLPPKHTA